MHAKRKRRLLLISFLLLGISVACALTLYALKQNINLYYTPSQVKAGDSPVDHLFRLGGLVKKGSIQRNQKNLDLRFSITDTINNITVDYNGVLPDLFKEGQGIVAEGKMNKQGVFKADQVLAKHGADYMPPIVKDALKNKL